MADIKAGGVRRAEALGRQSMGAVVMASMFFAFGEGKITGAGPTDPKADASFVTLAGNHIASNLAISTTATIALTLISLWLVLSLLLMKLCPQS